MEALCLSARNTQTHLDMDTGHPGMVRLQEILLGLYIRNTKSPYRNKLFWAQGNCCDQAGFHLHLVKTAGSWPNNFSLTAIVNCPACHLYQVCVA